MIIVVCVCLCLSVAPSSVRYHLLHPDYIHDRLKALGKLYSLRVLLVHVDTVRTYCSTISE